MLKAEDEKIGGNDHANSQSPRTGFFGGKVVRKV